MMILRFCCIFLFCFATGLLAACSPAVTAYHDGNTAYAQGDYQTAFVNYLYAANGGVVPAQYAVGYQYFYGQGIKRSEVNGIRWFERAAPHSKRARYALALIQASRPQYPWLHALPFSDKKRTEKIETRYLHSPKACVISVHCEK